MNAPCATYHASPVMAGRCGVCGWPEPTHTAGGDRVKTPQEIGERLSETFDPGGTLNYDAEPWATAHATAIDEVRAVLEAPLTQEISAAAADMLQLYGRVPAETLAVVDALALQVEELRSLERAMEDIDQPDRQARARLVKVAGIATAGAELLDRHLAKVAQASPAQAPTPAKRRSRR